MSLRENMYVVHLMRDSHWWFDYDSYKSNKITGYIINKNFGIISEGITMDKNFGTCQFSNWIRSYKSKRKTYIC